MWILYYSECHMVLRILLHKGETLKFKLQASELSSEVIYE